MPCKFPNCPEKKTQGHHVTYRPKYIVPLCDAHHRSITICNVNASEIWGRKLTNRERWAVWRRWLKGDTKPILTPNATKWMASWGTPPPIAPNCSWPGDVRALQRPVCSPVPTESEIPETDNQPHGKDDHPNSQEERGPDHPERGE
jgi:hypothetical protein